MSGKSIQSQIQKWLSAFLVLAAGEQTFAADGIWQGTQNSAPWATTSHWQGGIVASGADATASFLTLNYTPGGSQATSAIALPTGGVGITLGQLIFGNTGLPWAFSGASAVLTLQTTLGAQPTIEVQQGGEARFNNILAGNQGFIKTGGGILSLQNASNTITGEIILQAGTLGFTSGALNSASSIVINQNAILRWNTTNTDDISSKLRIEDGVTATFNVQNVNNVVTLSSVIGTGTEGTGILLKNGPGTLVLNALNTFTGGIRVNAGTLVATTLANGGVASSIGASGTGNTNFQFNGGTLRYIGVDTSTNRNFRLNASGGTIEASGTGALVFTSTNGITLGGTDVARDFTLSGTNTDDNRLSASLGDNGSGKTSLIKDGTGTWLLTANHTYTGSTTVNAGLLKLGNAGSLASKVTVNNTGSFDLRGSANDGVIVNAGGSFYAHGHGITGTSVVGGALILASGSHSYFDIGGTQQGQAINGYDHVGGNITTLELGGTIHINSLENYIPTLGDTFQLISFTNLTGQSATNNGVTFDFTHASLSEGLTWFTDNFTINGTISVIAVPEPGRALLLIFSLVGLTLKRSRSRQHRR